MIKKKKGHNFKQYYGTNFYSSTILEALINL